MLMLLAAILSAPPEPHPAFLDLNLVPPNACRAFDGKRVKVAFCTTMPYTAEVGGKTVTVCGPGERDGFEMVVYLKGNRVKDVDEGDVLRMTGTLHIVEHPRSATA
jgi:hypothetical protein